MACTADHLRIEYVHCSYVVQHSIWHASRHSLRSFWAGPVPPCFLGTQSLRQERYLPSLRVPSGLSLLVGRRGSDLPLIQTAGLASAALAVDGMRTAPPAQNAAAWARRARRGVVADIPMEPWVVPLIGAWRVGVRAEHPAAAAITATARQRVRASILVAAREV